MTDADYHIKLVSDSDLPADCDWAFVVLGGLVVLFLKRRAAGRPCVLADAWAAFRRLNEQRRRVA